MDLLSVQDMPKKVQDGKEAEMKLTKYYCETGKCYIDCLAGLHAKEIEGVRADAASKQQEAAGLHAKEIDALRKDLTEVTKANVALTTKVARAQQLMATFKAREVARVPPGAMSQWQSAEPTTRRIIHVVAGVALDPGPAPLAGVHSMDATGKFVAVEPFFASGATEKTARPLKRQREDGGL